MDFFPFASFGVRFFVHSISSFRSIYVFFEHTSCEYIEALQTWISIYKKKLNLHGEKININNFFCFGYQLKWVILSNGCDFCFSVLMHCTCFKVHTHTPKCLQARENKKVAWIVSHFFLEKGVSDTHHKKKNVCFYKTLLSLKVCVHVCKQNKKNETETPHFWKKSPSILNIHINSHTEQGRHIQAKAIPLTDTKKEDVLFLLDRKKLNHSVMNKSEYIFSLLSNKLSKHCSGKSSWEALHCVCMCVI